MMGWGSPASGPSRNPVALAGAPPRLLRQSPVAARRRPSPLPRLVRCGGGGGPAILTDRPLRPRQTPKGSPRVGWWGSAGGRVSGGGAFAIAPSAQLSTCTTESEDVPGRWEVAGKWR